MIDAWMQHPTARHSADPIFDSLRRWTRSELSAPPSVGDTVAVLDEAGISRALTSAWYAPRNVMISNDEVAAFVEESGGRLIGVGSVDISRPMEAMREVRRCIHDLGSRRSASCPGCGQHRPPIDCFTPCTLHAASWACLSVRR